MVIPEAARSGSAAQKVTLRSFEPENLRELVAFWNVAFADRRNFRPITDIDFRTRVLECRAFKPEGLILAWEQVGSRRELAGLAHAFRPPPHEGLYRQWPRKHELALLYVRPESRRMGVGSRLLHAAEKWLGYCPIYVGSVGQPCYGGVEGPRPPFFGSSEHMAISARDSDFLHFLARRGYQPFEPGSITMVLPEDKLPAAKPTLPAFAQSEGLRPVFISHKQPFTGVEFEGREHYTLLGANGGEPYCAVGLVSNGNLLHAHLTWFPMAQGSRRAAITNVWVWPMLRGYKFGPWLLDQALYMMQSKAWPIGGYREVELNTHTEHFRVAVRMYERRGFAVEDAWVTLVKT